MNTQPPPHMTRTQFRALLNLMMCSDPWPISGLSGKLDEDALLAYCDRVAKSLGYNNWIEAYHDPNM